MSIIVLCVSDITIIILKKKEDITLITICYSNHCEIFCACSIVEVFIQEENQSPIVWSPCKRVRISGYCTSIVMVCITHNMLLKEYGCRIHILPTDIFIFHLGFIGSSSQKETSIQNYYFSSYKSID